MNERARGTSQRRGEGLVQGRVACVALERRLDLNLRLTEIKLSCQKQHKHYAWPMEGIIFNMIAYNLRAVVGERRERPLQSGRTS